MRLHPAICLCFSLVLGCVSATHAQDYVTTYTIAVLRDGPLEVFDRADMLIEQELATLLWDDMHVVFKRDPAFDAGFDPGRVEQALRAALMDDEVDLILTLGVLMTHAAARTREPLHKPVIGAWLDDADLMGLGYNELGQSTIHNFNFVVVPRRIHRDLELFHEVIGFTRLHALIDENTLEGLHGFGFEERRLDYQEALGFEIVAVPMADNAQETLARIPDDAQAVYYGAPSRMTDAQWRAMIDGVNQRGLPSYSMRGHEDVERGVLAGRLPEVETQLQRRLALNIQQVLLGQSTHELPVFMPVQERLMLNAQTAVMIGYYPNWDVLGVADVIHEDALETGDPLTLEAAMRLALEHNIDLAAPAAQTDVALQDVNLARSALLPQVHGDLSHSRIDNSRARAGGGMMPRDMTSAGVSISQVIFSDPVLTQHRARGLEHESARLDEEDVRLDIAARAGANFLGLLQERALLRIARDNLKQTRTHLELARQRHQVQAAGPEEVYRWEAEYAAQQGNLMRARANVEVARATLNQSLGQPAGVDWAPRDIEVDEQDYYLLDNRLYDYLQDEKTLARFHDLMVEFGLDNSPALRGVDALIQARRATLDQARRAFYVPEVGARFMYDRVLDEHRIGGTSSMEGGWSNSRNEWSVGLGATLPLFEGGARVHVVRKNQAELEQLLAARERLRQMIELNVKNSLYAISGSHASIRFSRQARDRAVDNLRVISDKYAEGTVTVTDLADAQNRAFLEGQNAAIARYAFLRDLVAYQRAIAWFEVMQDEEARNSFVSMVQARMEAEGEFE